MTSQLKAVCVFCGSRSGRLPRYKEQARAMGRMLAEFEIDVVYGGGGVGLMGAVADEALVAGGRVIGVIPHHLLRSEAAHERVTELHVVSSMHERKAMMADLSDAFIALPGGFGTLEEIFETITWMQLGLHSKPSGWLNVEHYFDSLVSFVDHAVADGFIKQSQRERVVVEDDPALLLAAIEGAVDQTELGIPAGLEAPFTQADT